MSKGLHDDAKKLLGMMGKKKAAQRPMASSKKAVKKAEPTKVMAKPAKKITPVAAQPKKAPEKLRKATMQKPVAKSAPKAKAAMAEASPKPNKKMATRQRQLIAEFGEAGSNVDPKMPKASSAFEALERDLPKGGKKMAVEAAEHLAPTATSRAEMSGIKGGLKGAFKKGVEKHGGKMIAGGLLGGMGGAMLAGPAGLGLAALMEAVDAEDSNPASHDVAAERAAKTYAADNPRFDYGRTAPKAQLQNKLPSEVKAASIRKMDFTPDARGDNPDQAKMENDFAKELKKWPR